MDRIQYMKKLKKKVSSLPPHEYENVVRYYEEYFDEAGAENEHKVIEELGAPEKVAAMIKANRAFEDMEKSGGSAKNSLKVIFIVILAIFASPIAIPLAIVVFVCIVAFMISLLAVFFSLFATGIGLSLSGFVSIIAAIVILLQSPATSVFFIGFGLVLMAVGMALLLVTIYISKVCFRCIAKLVSKFVLGRGK